MSATPTPRPITVAVVGAPESLHPLYGASQSAQAVLGALFVGCIGRGSDGRPVALGCERVPTLDNGDVALVGDGADRHLEATFRIRPDWRWADGTPVTARDVLFAWQFVMAPEALIRDALTQQVFSMEAPDGPTGRTVRVKFMSSAQARLAARGQLSGDVPFEYFSGLGDYDAYLDQQGPLIDRDYWAVARWLPAHALAGTRAADQARGAFAARPLGDGAFGVASVSEDRIVLTRTAAPFPLDPAAGQPALVFRIVASDEDALALLAAGEADVAVPEAAPAFEQLTLNASRVPFDDARVREATARAARAIDFGRPPQVWAEDGPGPMPEPDAVPRNLLQQAGWNCASAPCTRVVTSTTGAGRVLTATRALTISLWLADDGQRPAAARALQDALGRVGISLTLRITDEASLAGDDGVLAARSFDAAIFPLRPIGRLSDAFGCTAATPARKAVPARANVAGLCDPLLGSLINEVERGSSAITENGRQAAWQAAARAALAAHVIVPLYSREGARSRGISGVETTGAPITWNAWAWRRTQ